mmetsp:Transcript_22758/g.31863  ORF Transcript_22758/g.31863 Transcript_22758/m.31863 type:complete len:413 (-) Transcript_22758:1439-2677(-)
MSPRTEKRRSAAVENLEDAKVPFYKIVLTGGPCGGKTTAMERISSYLRERGFHVFTCPEAFTIFSSNGLSLDFFGTDGMDVIVQKTVMNTQMSMEDGLESILRARGHPGVLLCDRGVMDGAAYMDMDEFKSVLQERNLNVTDVREGRYNAVYHLITAANGAEKYYTLENNAARSETPEEAVAVDHKTQKAWVGHPKLTVIDNSTDFEGKLQRLVESVSKLVGLPTNLDRVTTKFLLQGRPNIDDFPDGVSYHIFDVEKVYLLHVEQDEMDESSPVQEQYSFIRKRTSVDKDGRRGGSVCGLTTVQRTDDGKMMEIKRIISKREYNTMYRSRDLSRHIVRQQRISFLYNSQSFSIHAYEEPTSDVCILHAQVETVGGEHGIVDLPPFLNVERELQPTKEDQDAYGAFGISRIK